MEKAKNILKFFLGVPLTILAFGFIGKFIYDARDELVSNLAHFDILGILVGSVCFLLFFLFRSLLWKEVLDREGYKPSTMESIYLLAMSELRRYIPGSVLAIVGRVNTFSTYNIPSKSILKMIFFESVLFLLASIVLSIPAAIYLVARVQLDMQLILGVFFLLIIILLSIFVFAKKRAKELLTEFPKYSKAFLLICSAWAFFGLGNYLILNSFYRLNPQDVVAYVSFFVLSWLVGYVVVIMPLGLGVREGFLTYELSFSVPLGVAAALSIISRLAFVICEIMFVVLAYLIHKHWRPRPKIHASDAILWGMIGSYIFYFAYIQLQQFSRLFENILIISETFIIGLGALFVYEASLKILKDKSLSLVFAASYLLNPVIQKTNLFSFGIPFLINEAAVIGAYVIIVLTVEKMLNLKIKYLDLRFFNIVILVSSIIFTYYYGILPGAWAPYIIK